MRYGLTLIVALLSMQGYAQVDLVRAAAEIEAEGKDLYLLERASWLATDILADANFHNWKTAIGGYFSCPDGAGVKCIYYRKGKHPETYAVISFDSTFNLDNALIDSVRRPLAEEELRYYNISRAALGLVRSDTSFIIEDNANLNVIALPDGKVNKAYVVTGTTQNYILPLGNDYLLQFDSEYRLLSKEKLHNSFLPVICDEKKGSRGYHTHAEGKSPFMTPTDICTLLLYHSMCNFKEYVVVSPGYFSIWDTGKKKLSILTDEQAKQKFKK